MTPTAVTLCFYCGQSQCVFSQTLTSSTPEWSSDAMAGACAAARRDGSSNVKELLKAHVRLLSDSAAVLKRLTCFVLVQA